MSKPPRTFFLWPIWVGLLGILQRIWRWDPGGNPDTRPETNPKAGILSASLGVAMSTSTGILNFLLRKNYFENLAEFWRSTEETLEGVGLSEVSARILGLCGIMVLLLSIVLISWFIGWIIHHSEPQRSYVGHLWQGAAVPLGGIVLYVISTMMMFSLRWLG